MSSRSLKDRFLATFVTCGGLGYAPVASGTFGTLGGVAITALIVYGAPEHYLAWMLGAAAVISIAGMAAGRWAERRYGRKDPGEFVQDEVAGYLIAAAWIEVPGWTHLIVAFFVFRLFDIWKPWPANRMEKLPVGPGIVLDDLVAGLYAFGVTAAWRLLF
ncbi:MAG: phosphatidylglycerophosphatase A [Planctomycetota bacterium]|nr:phosphatidylglycerophosphatase A [Planctomycetota bacterium]